MLSDTKLLNMLLTNAVLRSLCERPTDDIDKAIENAIESLTDGLRFNVAAHFKRYTVEREEYLNTKVDDLGIEFNPVEEQVLLSLADTLVGPREELTLGHLQGSRETDAYVRALFSRIVMGRYRSLIPEDVLNRQTKSVRIDFERMAKLLSKVGEGMEVNPRTARSFADQLNALLKMV